jgi:hypothetical protein
LLALEHHVVGEYFRQRHIGGGRQNAGHDGSESECDGVTLRVWLEFHDRALM